jgi:hypothetical protein
MQKRTIIKRIKSIIEKYGSFSVTDVDGESSPMVESIGSNVFLLAERFDKSVDCELVIGSRIEEYVDKEYEDLSKDTLQEILYLAELYETDQEKTLKRISN